MLRKLIALVIVVLIVIGLIYIFNVRVEDSSGDKREMTAGETSSQRAKQPEALGSSSARKINSEYDAVDRTSIKTLDSIRAEDNLKYTIRNKNLTPADI